MLQVLVESRAVRARRGSWAGVSILVHSVMIGLAFYLTATLRPTEVPIARPESVVYTAPTVPEQPAAAIATVVPTAISRPSFSLPQLSAPTFELPASDLLRNVLAELNTVTGGSPIGSTVGATVPAGGIHTAATVDRIVMPLPGAASPRYPSQLARAGVEGEVLARFVVDTTGVVEPRSIDILQASHALFGETVRQWLTQNRYMPALAGGRPVRQLVQQHIGFTLTR